MTKKRLHISPDLQLEIDTVTNTTFILARRRVGKTYTASVIAEEMVDAGIPWVALDPTGTWWGFSSSADGKSEGKPVIVIGGAHGHLPLEPGSGKVIANMVADNPGWYIVDFSNFDEQSQIWDFAATFGKQLHSRMKKKPTAMKLFVDEADIFVPQKPSKGQNECLRIYDGIIRRGGVNGLGSTMISQRPALVNKDALTQADTLIVLQTGAPQDQDPVFDWVSRYGTKEQLEQIKASLASLKMGQAWYFSPDSAIFKLIQIRARSTFNSSATPKPGAKPIEPKVFSKVDLQALGEQIQATVVKGQMEDPAFLRDQIRRQDQIIRALEAKAKQPVSAAPAPSRPAKIQKIQVPAIPAKDLLAMQRIGDKITAAVTEAAAVAARIGNHLTAAKSLQEAAQRQIEPVKIEGQPVRIQIQDNLRRGAFGTPPERNPIKSDPVDGIDKPMQKILDALAWLNRSGDTNPLKRSVAFLAGYQDGAGGFTGPCSRLTTGGYIRQANKRMELTESGSHAARWPDHAATPQDIQQQALGVISRDGPMVKIFKILLDRYPDPISKDELAEASGYQAGAGGFTGPMSRLSKAGLVEYPAAKMVKAAAFLFME